MCDFAHLHTHSEYSTLDGLSKVKELIDTAAELGQKHLSITDHGSTSGLWEAQQYADEKGIHLVLGIEFYYQYEGDFKGNGHLLVLAENDEGLRNIFRLQKWSATENFYFKPRITFEKLVEHKEGLIVTSACLGSEFNQLIMAGDVQGAKEWARKYKEAFGESFYIEIQPNSIPEQHLCNTTGIRIARELGIPLVATNDVHYTYENDCFPHEVMLALQMNKKMSDENRFKFDTMDFWLKSGEEMRQTFQGLDEADVAEALANSVRIAERCTARIEPGKYLPTFYDVPEGATERTLLIDKVKEGVKKRRAEGFEIDKGFMQDVQNEIDVVDRNGYSGYFMVVQDFVNGAKSRGELVGDGRGSGAGSKVAWLTGITEIPPHHYDLLFERFMADGRSPDFDVDFSDQDAVYEDLASKYGRDNVARIISFGTMTPKSLIRKVLNAFEHPGALINQYTNLIPDLTKDLAHAIEQAPEILALKKSHPLEWSVIERLDGVISHEGQHAGGLIIYPNLSEVLPIKTLGEDRTKLIVAWDKKMLESLGHYKFDVLGLKTLPVLRRAVDSIEEETGERIDLARIDFEQEGVYNMLCAGDVSGVFQLNNQAQKVMEQHPRNFKDLIAINALIRPGVGDWEEYIARRKGKEYTIYEPRRPYMEETVGTMTYQEQFLLDAKTLAGWDIAYADKHIRKNKDIRNDEALRNQFVEDAVRNGHEVEVVREVWSEIEDAVDGGYSFNKSHSASYAVLSYQTAWLKYNYPAHFYAALMSGCKTDGDGQNEISSYIAECKERGIEVVPPDINDSGVDFVVVGNRINYRLTTVKHVGESAIAHILDLRPIHSFGDFMDRRDKSLAKKNVVINLIKAGAFDFDNQDRAQLLWEFDMSQRKKTDVKNGVETPRYEWSDKVKVEWEKEVLGMYLSAHPMEKYGFKPLTSFEDNEFALVGGEIYDMRVFNDKKGNEMAFIHINTLYGNVKALVFSRTWAHKGIRDMMKLGNIILVRGKRSGGDIMLDSADVLETKEEELCKSTS